MFHFGGWLGLRVKYAQISGLGNFSHLPIKSDSGFPPVVGGFLFHDDIRVIIDELFDG